MTGLFDGFEGYRVPSGADVDSALKSALVAIDANVLLNLYRYNARTTEDLLTIFEKLGDRLTVPHQAMREFHRNRLSAIGNPESAAHDIRSGLEKNERSTSDALVRWAKQVALDDADVARLQDQVAEVFERLLSAVGDAKPDQVHASTPAAEDPVLSRLSAVLEGKVLARPPEETWTELIAEGKRRVEEECPPGYLDAAKSDEIPEGAAGDFLVFKQACEAAIERGLDLVVVTGDLKEDWWWRHRSVVIGPRVEMTKEFFDASGGRQLFLLTPLDLLKRSAAFDVQVSPDSLEDAGRAREEIGPVTSWTREAVVELLARLDAEGQVHGDVIRAAADLGGVIDRDSVYEVCGYDDERMLRGFTRPVRRITADLQREGLLLDGVTPMLNPIYPDDARASGFRIPPEVVGLLRGAASAALNVATQLHSVSRTSKYRPLTEWLMEQGTDSIAVTFGDVEEVLGFSLAPSARLHLPYWYSTQNSLGKAIAAGGYKASAVDLTAKSLRLIRR